MVHSLKRILSSKSEFRNQFQNGRNATIEEKNTHI